VTTEEQTAVVHPVVPWLTSEPSALVLGFCLPSHHSTSQNRSEMSTEHASTPTTDLAGGEDTCEGDSSDDEPPSQHLTRQYPPQEGRANDHATLFARLNPFGKW
jgi:hypothetical protein